MAGPRCRVWLAVVLIAAAIGLVDPASDISAVHSIAGRPQALDDADAFYAAREKPDSAQRAVAIWRDRLSGSPDDVESAWKLARAYYWLGTNGLDDRDERKRALEDGVAAARRVIVLAPKRPEGHFWLAANMGALAESHGLRQGLRYRGAIKEALETVLSIDPAFMQGSADRALGRWYYKVPRLFGGDRRKSEAHLRQALAHNEDSIITRLFLAETLIALDRKDEAQRELDMAIAARPDPAWVPEDRRFQQQARALLAQLSSK